MKASDEAKYQEVIARQKKGEKTTDVMKELGVVSHRFYNWKRDHVLKSRPKQKYKAKKKHTIEEITLPTMPSKLVALIGTSSEVLYAIRSLS